MKSNEELNLITLLKDCPKGTKFYSPICGVVEFVTIGGIFATNYPIKTTNNIDDFYFTKEGYYNMKGTPEVLKKLALQAFTEIELQQATCVKSWKEFCKTHNRKGEYFINQFSEAIPVVDFCNHPRDSKVDKNLLASKKDAEAILALIQLKRLRDQWWESLNWKPDYTNNKITKYTIVLIRNKIVIDYTYILDRFLTFPTREIAEDFLKCFGDLIEKAKELI